MKLVADLAHAHAVAAGGFEADAANRSTDEVYGHLATALRAEMVCATDERMGMIIAPRYLRTTLRALNLGARSRHTVISVGCMQHIYDSLLPFH
jgi:hypothetical protein